MIQRRTFLGTVLGASVCLTNRGLLASPTKPRDWSSQVIQTVRHGELKRRPIVTGVSLQPQGNLLAIVGDDHYVSLYDMATNGYAEHLNEHKDWVRDAKFSPDGKMLFTCGNDHQLIGWSTDDLSESAFSTRRKDAIIKLAISSDSQQIASVGFNRDLVIHDASTGRERDRFRCPCDDIHAVAFSADGKLVAAGGRCGTIRVWNLDKSKKAHEFKSHRRRIRSLEFSESGDLVSAGDDQIVRVNKLDDPMSSFALPRHAAKLFAVKVISPSVIATSGSDNQIHIWNLDNLSEIGLLSDHTGTVSSLDFSQGKLVSGSFDATARIWTIDPDELAKGVLPPTFSTPSSSPSASASRSVTPGVWTRR